MQGARHLVRRSSALFSSGGRRHAAVNSARWTEQTRRESGLVFVDDPPTAPLSEDHEIGAGKCDFANWFDKGEDVSTGQAVSGLAFALGLSYCVYRTAVAQANSKKGEFTLREVPFLERDIPGAGTAEGVRANYFLSGDHRM